MIWAIILSVTYKQVNINVLCAEGILSAHTKSLHSIKQHYYHIRHHMCLSKKDVQYITEFVALIILNLDVHQKGATVTKMSVLFSDWTSSLTKAQLSTSLSMSSSEALASTPLLRKPSVCPCTCESRMCG